MHPPERNGEKFLPRGGILLVPMDAQRRALAPGIVTAAWVFYY
jgi:hypothetical protein